MTTFTSVPGVGRLRQAVLASLFSELQIFHWDRQKLTGTAASVTFTIPSGLRNLTVRWQARCDNAVQAQLIRFRINGDTGSNYDSSYTQTQNTTVAGASTHGGTVAECGLVVGSSATANQFASGTVEFSSWDNTGVMLGYVFSSQAIGSTAANHFVAAGGGSHRGTVARTSLTILPQAGNFISGSDFQVYGLIT